MVCFESVSTGPLMNGGLTNIAPAGLEFCVPASDRKGICALRAMATITMQLMEKDVKDDGITGTSDMRRWPPDCTAFGFLLATSTVNSIEDLTKVCFQAL